MDPVLPITRTKIIIPRRRSELITRQRLLSILEESQEFRLSIVSAPAGYGKTSLLIDFVHKSPLPVCWLSLDSLDQDPQRMISHFIYSIQQIFPEFGKSCLAALSGMSQGRLNLDALVTLVVNDAFEAIGEHFIIVLDDYHLVEDNADINYFINRFLMTVDENCHLIISSRRLLPLADMPLLVARAQVSGLGFEELAFKPEEIKDLYLQNHLVSLSDFEAEELTQLTEGWITGLILTTQLSGGKVVQQVHAKKVAGVGLYDYLAQQVLVNQPEEIQKFLYRTSLLEEFNAELCEKVIGQALGLSCNWRDLMQRVQRNNLFVLPVVEDEIWLRYHHLFRDFLKQRMALTYPEDTRKIERCQAEYFMQKGDWEQAYLVNARFGSEEDIIRLIEQAGATMIARGRLLTLQNWLEALPAARLEQSASLTSLYGSALFMLGNTQKGIEKLTQAIEKLKGGEDLNTLAHTYVRRSGGNRLIGEYKTALADAEQAIQITEKQPPMQALQAGAYYSKGSCLHLLGKLNQAQEWLEKARESFTAVGDVEAASKAAMEMGLVSRRLGQFTAAEETYRKVLTYYQSTSNIVWQANLLNNLGVLHHLAGDYENALIELERCIHYAKMGGYLRIEGYALVSLGDLFRDVKALKEASESYNQAQTILTRIGDQFLDLFLNLSMSEMDLFRGRSSKAKSLIERAQKIALETGSQYELNLCRLNLAKLAFIQKNPAESVPVFMSSLEFFSSEGYQVEVYKSQLWLGLAYYAVGDFADGKATLIGLINLLREGKMYSLLAFTSQPYEITLEMVQAAGNREMPTMLAELGEHIAEFEKGLPSQRNALRRQSQIVPLSAPELTVLTFGKTQIKIGEHLVSGMEWQSQSARDLLLLLMLQREGKTKEEIGAMLWPDSSPAELRLRFKNTIYRLRHAVGKDVILFENDRYSFNRGMDYEADFESFSKEIKAAEEATTRNSQIDHYRLALKNHNGPFLPDLSDVWVHSDRERYWQMYQAGNIKLAELLLEQGDFHSIVNVATQFLVEDRCNEQMVRIAMRAEAALGNQAAVTRQYELCVSALKEEVGSQPSPETVELYKTLVRRQRAQKQNLGILKS